MVNIASGMDRGRVRPKRTTTSRNMAAIVQQDHVLMVKVYFFTLAWGRAASPEGGCMEEI